MQLTDHDIPVDQLTKDDKNYWSGVLLFIVVFTIVFIFLLIFSLPEAISASVFEVFITICTGLTWFMFYILSEISIVVPIAFGIIIIALFRQYIKNHHKDIENNSWGLLKPVRRTQDIDIDEWDSVLKAEFSPTGGNWDGDQPYDYHYHAETDGVEYFMYRGKTNADGQAHGRGIGVYRDGTVYEGYYFKDRRHGLGKQQTKGTAGRTYIGAFFEDLKQGRGKLLNTKGRLVYEGKFIDGYPSRGPESLSKARFDHATVDAIRNLKTTLQDEKKLYEKNAHAQVWKGQGSYGYIEPINLNTQNTQNTDDAELKAISPPTHSGTVRIADLEGGNNSNSRNSNNSNTAITGDAAAVREGHEEAASSDDIDNVDDDVDDVPSAFRDVLQDQAQAANSALAKAKSLDISLSLDVRRVGEGEGDALRSAPPPLRPTYLPTEPDRVDIDGNVIVDDPDYPYGTLPLKSISHWSHLKQARFTVLDSSDDYSSGCSSDNISMDSDFSEETLSGSDVDTQEMRRLERKVNKIVADIDLSGTKTKYNGPEGHAVYQERIEAKKQKHRNQNHQEHRLSLAMQQTRKQDSSSSNPKPKPKHLVDVVDEVQSLDLVSFTRLDYVRVSKVSEDEDLPNLSNLSGLSENANKDKDKEGDSNGGGDGANKDDEVEGKSESEGEEELSAKLESSSRKSILGQGQGEGKDKDKVGEIEVVNEGKGEGEGGGEQDVDIDNNANTPVIDVDSNSSNSSSKSGSDKNGPFTDSHVNEEQDKYEEKDKQQE